MHARINLRPDMPANTRRIPRARHKAAAADRNRATLAMFAKKPIGPGGRYGVDPSPVFNPLA